MPSDAGMASIVVLSPVVAKAHGITMPIQCDVLVQRTDATHSARIVQVVAGPKLRVTTDGCIGHTEHSGECKRPSAQITALATAAWSTWQRPRP